MSFWCLQFPPKNEQKQVDLRFHSSKVEFVHSFFGGNIYLKNYFRLFLTFSNNTNPESQNFFSPIFLSFLKQLKIKANVLLLNKGFLFSVFYNWKKNHNKYILDTFSATYASNASLSGMVNPVLYAVGF